MFGRAGLAPDPMLPGPAGSAWADALAAIDAAAAAVGGRFALGDLPVWQAATAISAARLLARRGRPVLINTIALTRGDLPR
jgi:hypothetical protein